MSASLRLPGLGWKSDGWRVSAVIHVCLALIGFILVQSRSPFDSFDLTVIDAPVLAPPIVVVALKKPAPLRNQPQPRGVFGVSPHSAPASQPLDEVSVKAGNTVAKSLDQARLEPGDAESLPIPADEYLVTQMPKLRSEVRIPYPVSAKKLGVQGAVVMDLLIDGEGRVRDARLVEGPGHGLNEAAMEAVRGFLFTPAQVEKKAVAVRIRYAYRFVLER